MRRVLTVLVALYGFTLARSASATIARLQREAAAGDRAAQNHFTQTRYARLFGIRNSDLGLLFYGSVALAVLTGLDRVRPIRRLLLLGSLLSTLTSLYLLWSLFFRLRVRCEICLKAHTVNFALLLLLRSGKKADSLDRYDLSSY